MLIEKRSFEGGCNGDLSPRVLPTNVMLNCMNARVGVTEFGRDNRVENIPGTTAISQSVRPPYGTDQTIGAVSDNDRNRILYFNHNSLGFHGIYCLDYSAPTTPIIYAVLYDTQVTGGLGFSKTSRIDRDAGIVGNLLYWTDNLNQPRRINIDAGIKTNHSSYVTSVAAYSWPMTQSVIALIRRPFGLALTATKVTDGTITNNFIYNFAGQAAAQLTYRDSERSVWGSTSPMVNFNYSTDTFNAIDFAFDINEDFDQDVQIVRLAVRFGNDPNLFVIKTWNKAVTSEAAEITAHNAGSQALTFRFKNDVDGIAVGNADSVKPEDSVPLTAKTLTPFNNRLALSNYVVGYDTPTSTSLTAGVTTSSTVATVSRVYKSFSSYQISIRFRDYYGRKSAVVTRSVCIANIADRNYDYLTYTTAITWALSNVNALTEIPSWAYYYDILTTKNLRTRNFIQAQSFVTQYAKKQSDGTYTYQNNYSGSVDALAVSAYFLIQQGIGYTFSEGDLARIYVNGSATVNEVIVTGQDGSNILLKPVNLGDLTTQPQLLYGIYSPYKKAEDEAYFTTGQEYLITNPGTASRAYATTSGSILGDVYRLSTTVPFPPTAFTYMAESMSPNNTIVWNRWTNIYGEANFESILGQTSKTNFVKWSNPTIPGSATNGLSTFDALDEKSLPLSMGDISKIQVANKVTEEGNIMLAIGEKETASLYLGEVQLVGASANAFIASSPGVIGTVNILKGSYGTKNKESVIEYLGLVFWLDIVNGCFVQYSQAGLEPVSRYGMSRFFQRYCSEYQEASTGNLDNINGFHHTPTAIDPFNKEVLCTLPGLIYENYATTLPSYSAVPSYATSIVNRFDIFDSLGKSMAFSFEKNKWGSNFQFMAEQYAYLNNQLFAFKNGSAYTHNTDTTNWNTFYGVQQPMRICFTANYNPSLLRVLNNIAIEGTAAPNFTVALTAIPNIQVSDLAATDYTNQEGVYYATFLMDRLDPNASGTADQKLYTGSPLTDFSIFVMAEFAQYTGLSWVQFVDIGYSAARGQKQIINVINK